MMTVKMKRWWMPDSSNKFDCDVNIKSIHKEEFSNKWVGSLIDWYNPNCEVIDSFNSFTFKTGSILAVPVFRFCVKVSDGCH